MAKKKKGKIAKVEKLHKEGKTVKEIAAEMGIAERIVRSYIWRAENPDKYHELLKRYYAKRKAKQETEEKK
jgi:predicted transcriptional regulator